MDAAPPAPAPTARLADLAAPGLFPAFDPTVTEYTVAPSEGDAQPITVALDDTRLRVEIQSTAVTPGRAFRAWAPPEQRIDVVVYREYTEVARYLVRVRPSWDVFAAYDDLPPGAEALGPDEAARLYAAGAFEPEAPDAAEQADRRDRDAEAVLARFFAAHPELRPSFEAALADPPSERALQERGDVDPPEPDGTVGPITAPRAIDPPIPDLTFVDKLGREQTMAVQGREAFFHTFAGTVRALGDADNALRVYRLLQGLATQAGLRVVAALPTPDSLRGASAEEIRRFNAALGSRLDQIQAQILPMQGGAVEAELPDLSPTPCVGGHRADFGAAEEDSDLQSFDPIQDPDAEVCAPAPNGIFATDDRGYKDHLSCLKNQAHRGTCVSFAITSALESSWSKKYGTRVNLSEPKLYYHGKRDEGGLRDGLNTHATLRTLADHGFTVPWEFDWRYNPATWREKAPANGPYGFEHSCDGYDETCSDTAHQGACACRRGAGPWLCGWRTPEVTGGLRLKSEGTELWDPTDTTASVNHIKAALLANREVVLLFMVNESLKAAIGSDGYVRYQGEGQTNLGGHAMHIVGYVDNDTLALVTPDAPPGDFGPPDTTGMGGYLIARNSSGPCNGDGGYVYLPYRWLKASVFVGSAVMLDTDDIEATE